MQSAVDMPEAAKGLIPAKIVPLPEEYLRCSRTHLVILISRMLSFLIQINDGNNAGKETMELTRFHSKAAPSITVYQYLIRLTKYSSLEHSVLLSAVYYIDLLSAIYPQFTLNSLTVHRFLLTATTIASKGLCDSFCTNTHYSKVGGVQCSELNILENEFLERVYYRIIPRDDNIDNCKMEQKMGSYMNLPSRRHTERGVNNGFNVLQNYYKKIVQLVGDPSNSPDKSSALFFKFVDITRLENSQFPAEKMGMATPPSVNNSKSDCAITASPKTLQNRNQHKTQSYNPLPVTIPQKRNMKDDDTANIDDRNSVLRSSKKISSQSDG